MLGDPLSRAVSTPRATSTKSALEVASRPVDRGATEIYLKFRVRFPLHPFFVKVLEYFRLTVFQITPNGWAQMIELFGLFVEHSMGPPITAEFTWFYSVKGNKMTKASTTSPRDRRRGCRPLLIPRRA